MKGINTTLEPFLRLFLARGVELVEANLHLSHGGIAQYKGKWYCLISSFDDLESQKMTLCHELYHFDHHQGDPRPPNDESLEAEADQGARFTLARMEKRVDDS